MGDRKLHEMERNGHKIILYGNSQGDRELYIDGIHGISISGHVIKMNLYTVVPLSSEKEGERREVVARLVMSLPTLMTTTQFLVERIEELIRAGIIEIPGSPPAGGEKPSE